jgi:hypothetical protein
MYARIELEGNQFYATRMKEFLPERPAKFSYFMFTGRRLTVDVIIETLVRFLFAVFTFKQLIDLAFC